MWRPTIALGLVLVLTGVCVAEPVVMPLWPDGAPGAKADEDHDRPTITMYAPPDALRTGTAVIIFPGGGYQNLAMDHEGRRVAEWLNGVGVTAFVLKYRLGRHGYRHPAPMHDAQRAIRTVRANAERWRLKPDRVGVLGFSAGGHLASTTGTHFDAGEKDAADPIDRVSCRPDFMVLCYPVISFTAPYTHRGSRANLIGKGFDPELARRLSNELQVTEQTPPTFLMHAGEDKAVPPANSVAFYQALRQKGVAAELHLYAHGGHGFGLGKPGEPHAEWPKACERWLARQGLNVKGG